MILTAPIPQTEILQVDWHNWNQICEFVGIGKLSDGKPEGTFLDNSDNIVEGFPGDPHNSNFGIMFPTRSGLVVAKRGDLLVKTWYGDESRLKIVRQCRLVEHVLLGMREDGEEVMVVFHD